MTPPEDKKIYDVAIIGSGFASTILARVLRQQGQRVLVLEKGHHPRFALGESTTPLANFALERLARRSGLQDLFRLATYGRWMRHLPHLRRGLKRGFTFYQHQPGQPFHNLSDDRANDDRANDDHRLLVAASPDDQLADSHWLRQDVDHHLLQRAIEEGVTVHQDTTVVAVDEAADHLLLHTSHHGEPQAFQARHVVDGSGPAAVLPRSLGLAALADKSLPQASLLATHVDCRRSFEQAVAPSTGFPTGPYDDHRAAVHHLLEEGWIYVLPFDPEPSDGHDTVHRTSVGAVLYGGATGLFTGLITEPEAAWQRLLARYPSLRAQLGSAPPLRPWSSVERLAYGQSQAAGKRWFLLPHTYAFIDPMFSTGMAWSLLAVERLSDLLGAARRPSEVVDGSTYGELLSQERAQIVRLIGAARTAQGDFELFKHVAFLYFATVSHSELRQRLTTSTADRASLCWQGFLGASDPALVEIFETAQRRLARGDGRRLLPWLRQALIPYDAIGLDLPGRNNLYPVDLDTVVDRCQRLGLERHRIEAALPRLRGGESW